LKLKFQTVAEKTAKNFRGLLYLAAPGILRPRPQTQSPDLPMDTPHDSIEGKTSS